MRLLDDDLAYFDRGKVENSRFFKRLGGEPSFQGKSVIDIGCGHGSLCVFMALKGAKNVLGIDTDVTRIRFAQENLAENYPHLVDTCVFRSCFSSEVPECDFDMIVSKDTLEHIIGLDRVIEDVRERLVVGGRFYAGFGPLYYSPFGDHRRLKAGFPWGHAIISEAVLLQRLRSRHGSSANSVYDLGLNKLRLRDYEKIIRDSGLHLVQYEVNVSTSAMSKVLTLAAKFAPLRDYCSHNLYFILERKAAK